jgi:hypothetical protein
MIQNNAKISKKIFKQYKTKQLIVSREISLKKKSKVCCKTSLGPSNSSGNWPAPHKVCAALRGCTAN